MSAVCLYVYDLTLDGEKAKSISTWNSQSLTLSHTRLFFHIVHLCVSIVCLLSDLTFGGGSGTGKIGAERCQDLQGGFSEWESQYRADTCIAKKTQQHSENIFHNRPGIKAECPGKEDCSPALTDNLWDEWGQRNSVNKMKEKKEHQARLSLKGSCYPTRS